MSSVVPNTDHYVDHIPLCVSTHWLRPLIFKFLKEITWLTSVQWKTSLHLIRALPYQLIMARSGIGHLSKMAVTCRRHGRATEETQKLQKGGAGKETFGRLGRHLYLTLISLWMVPYIPETVPSPRLVLLSRIITLFSLWSFLSKSKKDNRSHHCLF